MMKYYIYVKPYITSEISNEILNKYLAKHLDSFNLTEAIELKINKYNSILIYSLRPIDYLNQDITIVSKKIIIKNSIKIFHIMKILY